MDLEKMNLKEIAEDAKARIEERKTSNPDTEVETQPVTEEQEGTPVVDINRMYLDAYEQDPSIAEVVSEILHQNIELGPAATKDNVDRLTNGRPALYADGRQWFKPGNEPEGWVRGTVELPDGRLLNPLQALYIIKKHVPIIKASASTKPITDEALLAYFIDFADEALALTNYDELKELIAKQVPPVQEEVVIVEDQPATAVEEKKGPQLPPSRSGRPQGMVSENDQVEEEVIPNLGGGIVIEKKKEIEPGELAPEKMEELDNYIDNMEKDFEAAAELRKKMVEVNPTVATAQEVAEVHGAEAVAAINNNIAKITGNKDAVVSTKDLEDLAEANANSREDTEKRLEKFNEVIISIDKVNADNLSFTDEERAKIEKVDKIRIEEVEMVDIQSLRRRKAKTGAVDTLLKRRGNTSRSFNMIIPASGYVATMGGCSLHELMNLINEGNDPVQSYNLKWSIIHSKLITTSIGDIPDYDYFMKHTADSDMNAFIYGIMVASLPASDSINLTCSEDACKQADGTGRDYEFKYDVRSLLRVEEFSDEMIQTLGEISAATTTLESAMEVHNNSVVMSSKAIRLPDSGDIIEIQAPSAYDFLERTLKTVTNSDQIKPEYGRSAVTASRVNAVIALDGNNDPLEITDPIEIIKFIYSLPARDIIILEHMIDKHTSNNSFNFGLVDITCPHCGSHTEVLPIDISELLFIRNAKVAETVVE